MSDLSKQQMILLALLVSFVTSLATGIVTVSLMDQAPQGMIQSITRVVDKTIQEAAAPAQDSTADASAASSHQDDALADSVEVVSQSIVQLRSADASPISGLGLVVSDTGVILADRSSVVSLSDYTAVLPGGPAVPVSIVQSQNGGDLVFLASLAQPVPGATSSTAFVSAVLGGLPELGQAVYALSGTSTPLLEQGVVTQVASSSAGTVITASLPPSGIVLGSPLFAADGSVVGIHTASLTASPDAAGTSFYSLSGISAAIPLLK